MAMLPEITTRAADTPDDRDRLRAYAPSRDAAAMLERHWSQPRYQSALTRVAERGAALAGYALLAHRRLRLGAAVVDAGAIEAMFVHDLSDAEAFEALLNDCVAALMDQGLPIITHDEASAPSGLYGLARHRFRAEVELKTGSATGTPLRAAAAGDLDDLAALYSASYAGLALIDERAAPDWRAWLQRYSPLLLEDARGRVVAYAAPARKQPADALAVSEAAAADAGAARQLCAALVERGQAEGRARVVLKLAPWHLVAQAALQLGGTAQLRALDASESGALAGVTDLVGLLEALAPELERRLAHSRYAGWNGSLRLELPDERVTLAFEQGVAAVIDGQRPADVRLRRITLPALAQLCLGYRAAADLRATGGLACDDSALGLIDALFPTVMAVEGGS